MSVIRAIADGSPMELAWPSPARRLAARGLIDTVLVAGDVDFAERRS